MRRAGAPCGPLTGARFRLLRYDGKTTARGALAVASIRPPRSNQGRKIVSTTTCNLAALGSICLAALALPALAADVTPQRLTGTAAEPQNWLMVHRDYDNSRHSPLNEVNRGNVKDLKLKFIFSIGGRATGGTLPGKEESTPLVDDGFMYVSDTYDRVMKFDVHSGTEAVPLWRYDPKITKSRTNRGIAMYGNKVFIGTNDMRASRSIAFRRAAWEVRARADRSGHFGRRRQDARVRTAPLALKTAAARSRSPGRKFRRAARHQELDRAPGTSTPASWLGTFHHPAPGEPGSETWKDSHNASAGGRRRLADCLLRSGHQPRLLRHWRCFPELRRVRRATTHHRQHPRARRRYRQDRVVFPGDAERALDFDTPEILYGSRSP